MIRYLLAAAFLSLSLGAQAQQMDHQHSPAMNHGATAPQMDHHHSSSMNHGAAMGDMSSPARPTEPGQGAFAAIQEIISILDANPNTDWSRVNIAALRRHLVDMSNVTLYARAAASPVPNGMRFSVTGTGTVRDSIRRMVKAHAATMNGYNGWSFAAAEQPDGAILTVTVSRPADLAKVKGLGFIGIMAYGMHHQGHHLMIASGNAPHE